METVAASSKAKQSRGTAITTITSVAKETRSTSTVGSSRTYSNGRSGENKCNDSVP